MIANGEYLSKGNEYMHFVTSNMTVLIQSYTHLPLTHTRNASDGRLLGRHTQRDKITNNKELPMTTFISVIVDWENDAATAEVIKMAFSKKKKNSKIQTKTQSIEH